VAVGTGLVLIPLVLAAVWSVRRARAEGAVAIHDQAVSVAATVAAFIDQQTRLFDSVAAALVHDPAVIGGQRAECDRLFADVLRKQPLLLNIILTGENGVLAGSGIATKEAGPFAMPHVRHVLETGRRTVSDLTLDPLTHHPAVLVGYPVARQAGAALVLTLVLNLAALDTTFNEIPLADDAVLTLTNPMGLVLARSRDADRYVGMTAGIPQAASAGATPSSWIAADVDGVERVVASAPVNQGVWVMNVGIPTSAVAARARPIWRRDLVVASLGILSSLALLLWFARATGGSSAVM
jgi:hypothetical protein